MGQYWSSNKPDIFYGQHEVGEYCEVQPANQNDFQSRRDHPCTKLHNGHREMILASEFTRGDLPEPYNQIEDIYKLIKTLAYLTVRIKVKCVSKDRPEYIPKTNENYPLFDKKGYACMHVGSGRICDVVTHLGVPCTCDNCKLSGNPSPNSYVIKVFTATHVVYDDLEAVDATCTLFYDANGKRQKVDLKGFKKLWCDAVDDLCLLKTVTCDAALSTKLFDKIKKFNSYWESLKYMREKDRKKEQLVIIVSHPHGGVKRISVGYGIDVGALLDYKYSKFVYNSPTCPGTSGAPVYILGYDWFDTEFVHGGMLKDSPEIAACIRIHSEKFSKIFPSCDLGSTVIPVAYSTLYNKMESEGNGEGKDSPPTSASTGNIHYSNYSARWYN